MADARFNDLSEAELRRRLSEAEDTLDAIREGAVDAVVVDGPNGQQIYTLESPDQPFRIFVEQMQEGALTVDGAGTIIYCNRFFADLAGRSAGQLIGARFQTLLGPASQDSLAEFLRGDAEDSHRGEFGLVRPDGSQVLVQIASSRLPSSEMPMFGMVVTDLTAREHARRLELERQAAQEASAARDQFLAVVSHELRTPLNAIMGWTQLLRRRSDLPEAVMRGMEIIERSGWSQAQLIDDLLDVSRVLAGKLRLEFEPVDLTAIVAAAIGTEQPRADAKRIRLTPELPDCEITVYADSARLRQVVCNVLTNAVKYTPEGGDVRISVWRERDQAVVDITDTGVGIAPEFLPKLFGLFEQADPTASRRAGGLGLGLSIVKQLTELHGGSVRIQSEGEGRGTTALIRLPISQAAPQGERQESNPADALTGLRVLLVEDEPAAREMLRQLLESREARVQAVATATEALAALEQGTQDVLVSDLGLPDVDGYELIRRVRAGGRSGRELPAVALTAFAGREDRRRVLLAGYQVHLPKPADHDELCAVIASLAGRFAS